MLNLKTNFSIYHKINFKNIMVRSMADIIFPLFCMWMIAMVNKASLGKKEIKISDLELDDFAVVVFRKTGRSRTIPATVKPEYILDDNSVNALGLRIINQNTHGLLEHPCGSPSNPCMFGKLILKYYDNKFDEDEIRKRYSSINKT